MEWSEKIQLYPIFIANLFYYKIPIPFQGVLQFCVFLKSYLAITIQAF